MTDTKDPKDTKHLCPDCAEDTVCADCGECHAPEPEPEFTGTESEAMREISYEVYGATDALTDQLSNLMGFLRSFHGLQDIGTGIDGITEMGSALRDLANNIEEHAAELRGRFEAERLLLAAAGTAAEKRETDTRLN